MLGVLTAPAAKADSTAEQTWLHQYDPTGDGTQPPVAKGVDIDAALAVYWS